MNLDEIIRRNKQAILHHNSEQQEKRNKLINVVKAHGGNDHMANKIAEDLYPFADPDEIVYQDSSPLYPE